MPGTHPTQGEQSLSGAEQFSAVERRRRQADGNSCLDPIEGAAEGVAGHAAKNFSIRARSVSTATLQGFLRQE